MKTLMFASVAFLAAAFACGTSDSTPSGTGPATGTDSGTNPIDREGGIGLDGGDAPPGSVAVTFGPETVQPGQENTKCVVKRLGNTTPIHVGTIHNVLSDSSHHLVVYRVNDTAEQLTPFECKPFTDTLDPDKGSTIMISQKHDDALVLPAGVAYTLAANQMVRLEMHYINPSGTAKPVTATSTFIPIENAKFKDEADFLFVGTPDINIPAKSDLTLGPVFIKLPPEYAGVNFFAITGHEHQYGTNVLVSTATSKSDTGTSVYNVPNWVWSEPATVQASPAFKIPANGGFNFTCSWKNTSDKSIKFGESANDEMCFFWAYYYPSKGAKVCLHTDQTGGAGTDACCPGPSPVCGFVKGGL